MSRLVQKIEFPGLEPTYILKDEESQVQEAFKELYEYEKLEEQGLLVKLPCAVGSTVYRIEYEYTKCSEYKEEFDEYLCQGCESLECNSHKEYHIKEEKMHSLVWIAQNLDNFGKTIFTDKSQAEQALKEMEEKS